ncbi:MAG: TonB family protein [Candidatus Sulfotelmatobacter sp.]
MANTESTGTTSVPQRQRLHSRRHSLRYGLQEPLDVTVLRSGVPDSVPGRSLNLGAGGLAAVLAGELLPGEVVGVEIHLPKSAIPLRARARVRHHDKLRCGMEFVGLSADQQAAIRSFAEETKAEPEKDMRPKLPPEARFSEGEQSRDLKPSARRRRGRVWLFFLALAAILLALFWWRWNQVWEDLESGLGRGETTIQPQAHVPADVMEKLVIHRVDPDYPPSARPAHLQGVIVLDIVVGRDGKVAQVRALNGPEILAQAAVDAMRWWRFEPYRVNGDPEVVETTVAVEFKP